MKFLFSADCPSTNEVTFHINYPDVTTAYVTMTKQLRVDDVIPEGWRKTTKLSQHSDKCYNIYKPDDVIDAYSWLIEQVYHGNQQHFVSTQVLLESWKFWGTIIDDLTVDPPEMRTYPPAWNKNYLDLQWGDDGLSFAHQHPESSGSLHKIPWLSGTLKYGPTNDVISNIVDDVIQAIQPNVDFHIALSGGNSPVMLLDMLSSVATGVIPWQHVHIWQVDERCDVTEELSNFAMISHYLIDAVKGISYKNVHPMITGNL